MFSFVKQHKRTSIAVVCSILTVLLLTCIMIVSDFAPFGNRTFAIHDAHIQYVDFFAYFKDVLEGKNNISYTLSESLGKDTLTTFSYYLASPLNLLIVFFPKSQIHVFFNLLIVLKLLLAAFAMSWFISTRFSNRISPFLNIGLSIGYAFSQYTMTLSSNIMWIDAIYILPFMILGVHYAVTRRKTVLLSLSTALCILFNWYSAGISCIFTIIWFVFEMALMLANSKESIKEKINSAFFSTLHYGAAMAFGVMISAVLFVPTILGLLGGKGYSTVIDAAFTGNLFSIISNWRLGASGTQHNPALFCGILAFVGCVGFFLSRRFDSKNKIIYGGLLFASLIIYFWNPLFLLFSLLNYATSYWYRYAFVSIFAIIFIAATFFDGYEKEDHKWTLFAGTGLSTLLLFIDFVKGSPNIQYLYYSVILFTAISIAVSFVIKNWGKSSRIFKAIALVLITIELTANAYILLIKIGFTRELNNFELNYQIEEQTVIDTLKENDPGDYRISQTSYRDNYSYNEAMAYGFWSPASYTSSPDMKQLDFLNNIGYWKEGNCITVVNTSLISADALLGVKYVLSNQDINGLVKLDNYDKYNEKYVYSNPYCLPMSFTIDTVGEPVEYKNNPFIYQNDLYSRLMNEQVEIFKELEYQIEEKDGTQIYTISIPAGNYTLYGNMMPARTPESLWLNVNNAYERSLGDWLNSPLFYIPVNKGDTNAYITLYSNNFDMVTELQLYALDLNELERISSTVSKRYVQGEGIGTDKMSFKVESNKNETLLLSIPQHKGWTVTVNGNETTAKEFCDCLIAIELEEGTNIVEFEYDIPGLKLGILVSVAGIFAFAVWQFVFNKKRKTTKE